MKLDKLLARLCLDGGSHILLIDESRALHKPSKEGAAAADKAPTSVAVIPLAGSLYPAKLSDFASRVDAAAANADVGHIVVPVDSPGGTYSGTPEAAASVAAAQKLKPVTAHIGALGASAAYWIASQAGHVVVSPSGDVGSIGVLSVHMDMSKMLEDAGLKTTIMRSVPRKAEGNSLEPLSDGARDHIQSEVDDAHGEFVRAVAAGRRVSHAKVNADFGQGRTMTASKAVAAGMADRVGSLADVIAGARSKMAAPMRRRSALSF